MNKTLTLAYSILGVLALNATTQAASVPDGFQDFYQQQVRDVEVKGLNGTFIALPMLVTYTSVQLQQPNDTEKLVAHFVRSGVTEVAAKKIANEFMLGTENSVDCVGDLNLCSLNPESFDTFYDYHSNKLYVYVNKSLLANTKPGALKKEYASTYNANPGLINRASLYTSSDFTDSPNLSLSDQLVIGLPYGSVHLDAYASNQDNASEVNYGYYNIENKNLRLTAGYHQDRLALNSTSFLLNGTQYHDVNVNLSSSKNLSRASNNDDQFLFYYAPSNGVLKVYKDEQIIAQKSVTEGQGSIRYSELPNGVYDVTVEITTGSQVVSSESVRVYNAQTDTLNTGELDFFVAAGQFQGGEIDVVSEDDEFELEKTESFEAAPFLQGMTAYKWSDTQTIALGSTLTEEHIMNQIGLKGYLPFESRYELTVSSVDGEATYLSGYLNIDHIGVTYEKLENEEKNRFAQYLYGATNKEQLSLSGSFALGDNIRGYGSVNYLNQADIYNNERKNWFLSSGVSSPFVLDSTIDVNLSYNNEVLASNFDEGEVTLALNWSVPLASKLRGKSSVTIDQDGFSQYTNSLETRDLIESEETDVRLTASNSYYSNSSQSSLNNVTAYAANRNDHYQADGFVYVADNGEKSVNASLSSTQVIGKNSVNFTTKQSDAYVTVETQNNIRFDEGEEKTKGLLVVKADEQIKHKEYIYGESALIPLDEYQTSTIELDVESVALHNTGQQNTTGYTHPGTVIELNSNVSRVISFVSKFKDIFGNDIEKIECEGPACLSISNITSGIHKIDVQEGQTFSLTSGRQQCYLPSVDDAKQLNFGTNYCQPALSPMESIVLVRDKQEINVMYIGQFDDLTEIDQQLKAMTDNGTKVLTTRLGRKSFVYLTGDKDLQLSHQQRQNIENVAQYANSETQQEHDFVLNRPEGN
ncbi:TcfC E-set like domain-containing protein [Vibrio hyugaensis]|uniref:TcfC E-set like domain-containing protein n=1 Tax=Vibrio hyugaensis TaxID=1534743 RepID=UPI0006948D07|nr:TcfC E-set like domain-containing protein [Vibrio hyugaensis]